MMFSQRVGFFPPAATVSPFVGSEITTTTNILYPFTAYSTSSMAYVGPDNANRPIFAFLFIDPSTGALKGQAIRINDNGTIFQGITNTLDASAGGIHTVALTSTFSGAGSYNSSVFNFNTTPPIFYSYIKASTSRLMVGRGTVSVTQAGLGVNQGQVPQDLLGFNSDGDFPVAAYLGNSPIGGHGILFGLRTGTGVATRRCMTNLVSNLTVQGPAQGGNGGPIDTAALGFAGDFTISSAPVYRSAFWNTGSGAQTTVAGVMSSRFISGSNTANYLTQITTSPSVLDTSVYNQACNLNNSNKFLGVSYLSPANSLNLTVVDVNWNTPPSFPTPTTGAFVSAGSADALPTVVSGTSTDSAFLVQSPVGASSLTYANITVSGTVPTVGSTQTLFGGLSNCQGPPILATAKIGTKTYMAGIQSRSGTNTPYVFGVRFT